MNHIEHNKLTFGLRFFSMMLGLMLMAINFTACNDDDDDDKNPSIIGTWEVISNGYVSQLTFNADGSCFSKEWPQSNPNEVEVDTGKYIASGNTLSIWWASEADEEGPWTCTFTIDGNRMTTSENGGSVWFRK